MKISGEITSDQRGTVKIIPDDADDLWLAYNLIAKGDAVSALTTRKVLTDGGGRCSARVRLSLEINVIDVEYEKSSSSLRARGKTITAAEDVPIGSFHTLDLEINKEFGLSKKRWSETMVENLRDASERATGADLAAILFQEGTAQVYLVGNKIKMPCPEIRASGGKKSKSNKFFESVLVAFLRHVDFDSIKCVIFGIQGSIKDEFYEFLIGEAQRKKLKSVENNKSRIVKLSVGGGKKSNLINEILNDNTVMTKIKDTKTGSEIRAFKEFSLMMMNDPDRTCYGPKEVEAAGERMAIETLLITDDLVRNAEIATRKKFVELVDAVRKGGGKAYEYSAKHGSGEELGKLTGIAATLRFPMNYLEETAA